MRKTLLLAATLCVLLSTLQTFSFFVSAASHESPAFKWSRTFKGSGEDIAISVIQTAGGGYFLAGTTRPSSSASQYDLWLVRTDASGNALWNKTYGKIDEWCAAVQTDNGGYAIASTTTSFGAGGTDFWLIRIDADGNALWNKTYGGASGDWARYMIRTKDGGYAIVGFTGSWNYDVLLVKTDSMGNMQWSKNYGGNSFDQAYAVVENIDGSYAIAGFTNSFGAGGRDFWLVKTDSEGNMQWSKTYGGPEDDYLAAMVRTSDNKYLLVGPTHSFGAGNADFWLLKTDADGNMLWNKTYGGTGDEVASSVIQTSDGDYTVAGWTDSFGAGDHDAWLVETDSEGNMQWNQTYGGTSFDVARSVIQTTDGGYAVAGHTQSSSAGNDDFYLISLASHEPDVTDLQFWTQWWFWTIIALAASATILAFATIHYQRKSAVSKGTDAAASKSTSKECRTCPNCGATLPADSKFCGKCGTSLE